MQSSTPSITINARSGITRKSRGSLTGAHGQVVGMGSTDRPGVAWPLLHFGRGGLETSRTRSLQPKRQCHARRVYRCRIESSCSMG